MPASLDDKALAAFRERRVRLVKASENGVAADVAGSIDPTTLARPVYRAVVWSEGGEVKRRCSCPAPRSCYHLRACEMLWRPVDAPDTRLVES